MFDLYVLPLALKEQKETSSVEGYYVSAASRRAARTRESDLILFKFSSSRKLSSSEILEIDKFLQKSATSFFRTNGPVTTAIRKCGGSLNEWIVKFNQGKKISQILAGTLQIIVFHGDGAYLAHAGSGVSFVINIERPAVFVSSATGSQGIGVTRAIKFTFFHVELKNGDRIVLSSHPPQGWTKASLSEGSRNSISQLRKVLLAKAERDFEAIILQVRNGSGAIHQLRLDGSALEHSNKIEEEVIEAPVAYTPFKQPELDPIEPGTDQEQRIVENLANELAIQEQSRVEPVAELPVDFPIDNPEMQIPFGNSESDRSTHSFSGSDVVQSKEKLLEKESNSKPELSRQDILFADQKWVPETDGDAGIEQRNQKTSIGYSQILAKWLLSIKNILIKATSKSEEINSSLSENTAKLISRSSLSSAGSNSNLSLTSMFFIAILVPVLVVALSMTIYFRSGRGEQHQKFVLQASTLVTQANEEIDDVKRLIVLQDALLFLDEADKYGKTDVSQELRLIVQKHLDDLQGVTRLQLQESVPTGIDRRINISKMVVNSNEDLYALDQVTGRVLRMVATRPDYEVDTTFMCGPGKFGQTVVHELVDIDLISYSNSRNATIIGIDRVGTVILCSPGSEPFTVEMKTPEMGWGQIQAIGFNGYSLYILDIDERTRDIYRLPADGLTFEGNPESIFNGNIPDDLANTADIALYESQLYVLSKSGKLMGCALDNVQIQCTADIGYGIIQSGQERQTIDMIAGTDFIQIQTTQPPDPSIYFLDQLNGSVYHFSLALNMQKQISPDFVSLQSIPDSPLTAFTVSPYGIIHFAFGHALYFGYIP